jgi:hypothetical protein
LSAVALVSNDGEKLTTTEGKEVDLRHKAKRAKNAFQELFTTAIDKGKSIASQKAKKLVAIDFHPSAGITAKDSADIATQGPNVEGLTRTFEDIMTGIRHESYRSRQFADRLWVAALGANCRHRFKEPLCEEAKEVATVSFAVCLASKALSLLRDNNAITYS